MFMIQQWPAATVAMTEGRTMMDIEKLSPTSNGMASLQSGTATRARDLSPDDVASLHRHLFADGSLDRGEAEALFDLERAALSRCESWMAFFIEAVTDHVVWGMRPTGRLEEDQAAWLIAQADATRTPGSFALLVNVLDEAQDVPPWFAGAVRARGVAGWPGVGEAGITGRRSAA